MPAKPPSQHPKLCDIAALDAAIDAYVVDKSLAPRTRRDYEYDWKRWERFCEQMGVPSLGAPWAAFEAMWIAATCGGIPGVKDDDTSRTLPKPTREAGKGSEDAYSLSFIDHLLAAVAWKHKQAGLVPAFQQPQHAPLHSQIRRGYERTFSTGETKSAKPLRPADVRSLNSVEPPLTSMDLPLVVALFLSLDRGWGWKEVRQAYRSIVTSSDRADTAKDIDACDGPVTFTDPTSGDEITLDHVHDAGSDSGFLAALPSVCVACLITALRGSLHTSTPPPAIVILRWRKALARVSRNLKHLKTTSDQGVTYTGPPDDDWAWQGTRLALLYSTMEKGMAVRSAQARISLAWPIGLRSASDLNYMSRTDVTIRPNGSLLLTLPRAKTDQYAQSEHFTIPTPPTVSNTTGRALQWLAIIDALTNMGGGPLFPVFATNEKGRTQTPATCRTARTDSAAAVDLQDLQMLAGLEGFTPHSTRTGFAVTGVEQGHSQVDLQQTMRLKQPRHFIRYSREAHTQEGSPGEQLLRALLTAGQDQDKQGDA